jgi:hypothetical protein
MVTTPWPSPIVAFCGSDRVTKNVSSGSLATLSLRISMVNVAEVWPAGMVTVPVRAV